MVLRVWSSGVIYERVQSAKGSVINFISMYLTVGSIRRSKYT